MLSALTTAAVRAAAQVLTFVAASLCGSNAWAQQTPSDADLQALTYYFTQGDAAATQAELRRLQLQFPDWTPPPDLGALVVADPGSETEAVYQLIAAGRTAEATSALEELRGRYPRWTPPPDMMQLIKAAEAQSDFDAAVAGRDLVRANDVARLNPDLRRCDRVNNVWRLAELQGENGQESQALAAYGGVVAACEDFKLIVASLEKAAGVAGEAELRGLFARATPRFPQNGEELAALEARLLAGLGATAASTARPNPAAGEPAAGEPAAGSRAQRQAAAPRRTPRRDVERSPDGLPLRGDNRIGAVRSASEQGDWGACLASSVDPRSVDLLYARAWCSYNFDRPMEALVGFRAAAVAGLDADATRDAGFGMALAYLARNMTEEAARVAARTPLTRDQRKQVETIILDQRAVTAFQRKDFRQAIAFLDALELLRGSLRMDLAMLRGYAYLELGERRIASSTFNGINSRMSTTETRAATRAAAPTGGD